MLTVLNKLVIWLKQSLCSPAQSRSVSLGISTPSSIRDWKQLFRNSVQAHFVFIFRRNFSGSLPTFFLYIASCSLHCLSCTLEKDRAKCQNWNSATWLFRATGPLVNWIPTANSSAAASGLNFVGKSSKTEEKETPINKNSKTKQVEMKCSHWRWGGSTHLCF